MNIHLGPTAQVPYLSQSTIKEFASLIVYSEDGTEFQFNTLLLVSWSSFWRDILEDFLQKNQDIIIYRYVCMYKNMPLKNRTTVHAKKTLEFHRIIYLFSFFLYSNLNQFEMISIRDFIMKGMLPCLESDIFDGKLPKDIDQTFLSFGIDLKYIVNSLRIKMEDENYLVGTDSQIIMNR